MNDRDRLDRTFANCTERMKRVWREDPPPKLPEYEFTITFIADETTGKLIKQFVGSCPTRARRIRWSRVGGGGEGCQGNHT